MLTYFYKNVLLSIIMEFSLFPFTFHCILPVRPLPPHIKYTIKLQLFMNKKIRYRIFEQT